MLIKTYHACYFSRLICSGKSFSIEIYYDEKHHSTTHYCLSCTLKYNLFSDEHLKNLIEKSAQINISSKERDDYVEELIDAIKAIPEVEIQEMEDIESDSDILFSNIKIGEFIPYSANCNPDTFNELNMLFSESFELFETVEISKQDFEMNLKNKSELEFAYIDVYNKQSSYYCLKLIDERLSLEIYLMTAINKDAVFYFFKSINSNI